MRNRLETVKRAVYIFSSVIHAVVFMNTARRLCGVIFHSKSGLYTITLFISNSKLHVITSKTVPKCFGSVFSVYEYTIQCLERVCFSQFDLKQLTVVQFTTESFVYSCIRYSAMFQLKVSFSYLHRHPIGSYIFNELNDNKCTSCRLHVQSTKPSLFKYRIH